MRTDVGAKYTDGPALVTYGVGCSLHDKLRRVRLFTECLFLPFPMQTYGLQRRSYMTSEALPTTKRVEFPNRRGFRS